MLEAMLRIVVLGKLLKTTLQLGWAQCPRRLHPKIGTPVEILYFGKRAFDLAETSEACNGWDYNFYKERKKKPDR